MAVCLFKLIFSRVHFEMLLAIKIHILQFHNRYNMFILSPKIKIKKIPFKLLCIAYVVVFSALSLESFYHPFERNVSKTLPLN